MTGRELIIYILENHLEDQPIIQDEKIIGFLSEEDAAIASGVGTATVRAWIQLGRIESASIGSKVYIPATSKLG